MKWIRLFLPALVLVGMTLPAQAQFFRKTRLTSIQVPELLVTAKTDPDERKRVAAIEHLREFDAKNYPDMVPILVDILLSDPVANVRLEAVHTLTKIRPVPQTAGQAMEMATHKDENWRVRWQAKTALWGYQLAGYRPTGNKDTQFVGPTGPTTQEPPLAEGPMIVNTPVNTAPTFPGNSRTVPTNRTEEIIPTPPSSTPVPLPGSTPSFGVPSSGRVVQGTTMSLPRPLPAGTPTTGFSTAVPPTSQRVASPTTATPVIIPVQE